MRDANTPDECPKCKHVAWHELVGKVNTRNESVRCTVPGCRCVKHWTECPIPKDLIRVDGEFWDYASNAHKYDRSRVRFS